MDKLFGQFSYQVFLYLLWVFLLFGSVLGVIVGSGLLLRSHAMLRFLEFMNRWVSVRKIMRPLSVPHYIEPVLMKQPARLGAFVTPGATTAVVLLNDVPAQVFQPIFLWPMGYGPAVTLSQFTKWFLLVGNELCIILGLLLLLAPHWVSRLENYTDKWYSLRKRTKPLYQMHNEVDQWVLAHSTVCGAMLSIISLGLGFSMYARI